ncbi:sulfur carrier protein ThiS [Candidatus Zinderia endosymbiont of Aphrophora alni]|uniref:sulfur carrier protein ThiS n=1 Tax=Candidatus Zinderia endosymbiont of Aphrophora alni TaxID=3077951 RepID=UPI0030D5F914
MKIKLNGKFFFLKNIFFLNELIIKLNLNKYLIAVSVNKIIIQICNWSRYLLNEGDCVDIITAVGGG